MTIVNKCPDCNAVMLRSTSCESCGWPKVRPKHQEPPKFKSEQCAILRQKMGDQLKIVNGYVAKYQQEHPGSTKREACHAFMKSKNVKIPKEWTEENFDNAMEDYRAEAEA
jgi:hypothetical protein